MKEDQLGVAITKCFYCQGDDKLVMNTRLTARNAKNVESMSGMVVDMDPCTKCEALMKDGVIIIGYNQEKSDDGWNKQDKSNRFWLPNPYRSGEWSAVRDRAFETIHSFLVEVVTLDEAEANRFCKASIGSRWCFMPGQWMEYLGFNNPLIGTKKPEDYGYES